ncbi:MAG: hypothetical protein HY552_07065 [Elusimicrobia bacterium]|nr:hypothetical protein [Elusimicrobiota bacterium]
MSASSKKSLESLIHDVGSKCASLKSAAALLKSASPQETKELLALMAQQAKSLAETIQNFRMQSEHERRAFH